MTYLAISKIRRDGGTQPRVGIIRETVEDYAHAMQEGDTFPPVTVFHDGEHYWLADGFHRVTASLTIGDEEIDADVKQGDKREAILFSVGANATHGERRTNEDKRAAVKRLLRDDEWGQWSNNEIAKRCRVSDEFVRQQRLIFQPLEDRPKRKVTRGGTTYTQDTSKIGTRPSASDAKPGYVRNETGGLTRKGFEPPNPDMAYRDPNDGSLLHTPLSENEKAEFDRKTDFAIACSDNFNWILELRAEQFEKDLLPADAEEVGGLLAKAAAHLCNLSA